MNVQNIIRETKAYRCVECGMCTGGCPIAWGRSNYSPRLFVKRMAFGFEDRVLGNLDLWSCLTCGLCNDRCPSQVDYLGFMKAIRREAFERDIHGIPSHDGTMQVLMDLQGMEPLRQNRTSWLSDDLEVSREGDCQFFVGCLPYFQVLFEDIVEDSIGAARGTIKLLNRIGIAPMVSDEERCCGHDLLWSGDQEGFEKLARQNLKFIRDTGAKKVVFYCPECYETFRTDYSELVGTLDFEPVHITTLLAESPEFAQLSFRETPKTVTYQDPCRLGRFAGIYEEPRKLIEALPGARLVEMDKERTNSVCCGSSQWLNCFTCSKQIQLQRISQAKDTRADTMITACPKCRIHLNCALRGSEEDLEIKDLITLAADAVA